METSDAITAAKRKSVDRKYVDRYFLCTVFMSTSFVSTYFLSRDFLSTDHLASPKCCQSPHAETCSYCNSAENINCDVKSGYVVCSCKPGLVGNGVICTIMALCDTYTCCPDGYTWSNDNKQCVDIDECASPTLNKCSPTDTCVNRNGYYLCIANRNAPCGGSGTSPCSNDVDCLWISGAAQCADPCYNYQQVNGDNRLANMSSTGRFPTDRNLVGWHRYVGTGSSLKEGCVGPLMCGSLEPFSLGGSNPSIGDGIQMVSLLINRLSGGCTQGGTIPVKACPGGYYVYKFSPSLRFDVYCTDHVINILTTIESTKRLTVVSTATPTTTSTTTTPTTTPTTTSTTATTAAVTYITGSNVKPLQIGETFGGKWRTK
ncbi:uromodulin-like [Hyperolius riggenbachi]|uniref:uromodulin-like n=1 Tax=Hyperolius riggenbachi TaxID=752182 RepID=UPI0035A35A0D